jgi:hypothetical protein
MRRHGQSVEYLAILKGSTTIEICGNGHAIYVTKPLNISEESVSIAAIKTTSMLSTSTMYRSEDRRLDQLVKWSNMVGMCYRRNSISVTLCALIATQSAPNIEGAGCGQRTSRKTQAEAGRSYHGKAGPRPMGEDWRRPGRRRYTFPTEDRKVPSRATPGRRGGIQ